MKWSWLLSLAVGLKSAAAGNIPNSAPAGTEWVDWSTTTVTSTIHDTTTSYVTVMGPTSISIDYQTSTETSLVSVTGPTSVSIDYQTSTETSLVSVTGPTTTVTQVHVITQNLTTTTTSTTTSIVSVPGSCSSSSLSGLVLCPTRIINPTYTPATPLPSNYLWGCPPGKLCHPKREGCNFERDLPADTYVCAPEECLPTPELPSYEAFVAANLPQSNDSCAWLTPIDGYFNLNPEDFDLDYSIFNVYGRTTCTSSSAAPSSNKWGAWSGPAPTSATGHGNVAPPQVTKRAELAEIDLMKRQGRPIIAVKSCYPDCDYAAAVWASIGPNPVLCNAGGPWSAAFDRIINCNARNAGVGPSRVASKLDEARAFCVGL